MSRGRRPYQPPHNAGDKFMEVIAGMARTGCGFRFGSCCASSAFILLVIVALIVVIFLQ